MKFRIAFAILLLTACRSTQTQFSSELAAEKSGPPYLALGDSIAFGHNPLLPMTVENVQAGQFIGYPEVIAKEGGYRLTNAACIGETSGSFINKAEADYGCRSGDKPFHPFTKLPYAESQLDFAKTFLRANPETALVTINIGGNDLLLLQHNCKTSFNATACQTLKLTGTVLGIAKNLSHIIQELRGTGYQGPIVVLTQYATNYQDNLQWIALGSVKKEIEAVASLRGALLARGYDAFKDASSSFAENPCQAGLLIPKDAGRCDEHPSEQGRKLLGQTVLGLIRQ